MAEKEWNYVRKRDSWVKNRSEVTKKEALRQSEGILAPSFHRTISTSAHVTT